MSRNVLVSVCALGLLSIAALWTAILYDEHADREAALHYARAQTLDVAIALREHVHGVISNADLVLQRVDDDYAHSTGAYALPQWVTRSQILTSTLLQVSIIGPDGHELATTLEDAAKTDLSDREHFRVHLEPGAPQPFISQPVIGRVSGKPSIQITRRIERPDGGFAGVGVVSLDPAYFNRFFQSIDLGPNSLIFLAGRDGVLRARASRTGFNVGIGQDFSRKPIMRVLLSEPQGTYQARSNVDGIERIYGFAADSEYPVIVATGMAVDDALTGLRSAQIVQFVMGACLSIVVLWLVFRSLHELSQRIESEKQLRQSQKLEAIGQLTAGIAHDFNNILTAIRGNAERARMAIGDPDRSRLLGNVEQAAQKGERIVSNLLAYSRQQKLRSETVDVNEIVSTVVDLLRAGLGAKWTIRCRLAPRLSLVMADSTQVETALLNLAINARDAMPEGGAVTFETRQVEVGETGRPPDLGAGSYVAISAKDEGMGMPVDVAAKAFDPFFTTKAQGTGLGLSQVYGLAKQLGGTAMIDTAQRSGTIVTIYLPALQKAPTKSAPVVVTPRPEAPVPHAASTREGLILVADDDPQVREFICSTLSDENYNLVEAHDGPSALDALERYPVKMAVLDISMPGLSGIDVYERASAQGWNGAVLFVSGFTDLDNIARIRGKPFLAKPFRAKAVRDQVATLLAGTDERSLASPK